MDGLAKWSFNFQPNIDKYDFLKSHIPDWKYSRGLDNILNDYRKLMITQPASTEYHSAYEGGWIDHTLSVVEICKSKWLSSIYDGCTTEFVQSLLFVAVLHDIGKLGSPEYPGYLWDKKENKFISNPYYMNKVGHELRSVWLLNQYGVKLTEDEFTAIVYHAGLYRNDMNTFCKIENPLVLLLHTADNLAAKLLEKRGK
jgi:3'-5' exoribonuclease